MRNEHVQAIKFLKLDKIDPELSICPEPNWKPNSSLRFGQSRAWS